MDLGVRIDLSPDAAADLRRKLDSPHSSSPSAAPPRKLPVIWIDVEQLIGYIPDNESQEEELKRSLKEAIFENPNELDRLFETKLALHADTSMERPTQYLEIAYPESLSRSTNECVSLSYVWKALCAPHPIAVVEAVFQHLQSCHRALLWKYDMKQAILEMIEKEQEYRLQRDLEVWKCGRRQQELDKLYMIRDTMVHQIELADHERSAREQELQVTCFDLEVESPSGVPDLLGFADNIETKLKDEEEERVRNACPHLKVAIAKVHAIQERLEQVDALLESLQEEEWAAQEEQQQQQQNENVVEAATAEPNQDFTLLDQILAMILPTSWLADERECHEEHQRINRDWKEYFGRLPPACRPEDDPAVKRQQLGIVDNDADTWDDDDEEDTEPATTTSSCSTA